MRYVHNNGSIGRETPSQYYIGVRPAFYLDTNYFLTSSGDGTSTNPYVGSAPNKVEADYTIEEPKDDINQEWNVSTEESIKLTLGQFYSSDGKYSNPTIPVYTIQKTRSDNENMVIVICGEGYTKNQQNKFISDVKEYGPALSNMSHIEVLRIDLMSTLFVQHQSLALKMKAAHSLM